VPDHGSFNRSSFLKKTSSRFFIFIDWFRDHYLPIIFSGLILGFVIGIWNTAPGQVVKSISSYLTFLMMFCVSLTVSPRHFILILRNPRSILLGMGLNFLLLPAICWAVATFLVSDPLFSAGILLIGLVPSAINASVWTALLDGETAISMAVNACSIILSSLLIPPIMTAFMSSGTDISLSGILKQVVLTLMAPLSLGLLCQFFWGKYLLVIRRVLPVFSAMIGVVFAFGTCNLNTPTLITQRHLLPSMLLVALLIFPTMFTVSYWISSRILGKKNAIAITFAGSMKNLSVAMGVAFANFPPAVALPITIFSIPHMATSVLFYQYFRKKLSKPISLKPASIEALPTDHSS